MSYKDLCTDMPEVDPNMGEPVHDEEYEDLPRKVFEVHSSRTLLLVPDMSKYAVCMMLATVTAFAVLLIEIIPPQAFPHQTDIETQARLGLMYSMQNVSRDECTEFYDYACESFNNQYDYNSLFLQTQTQIDTVLWRTNTPFEINTTVTGSYTNAGFYDCYDVYFATDYQQRTRRALYISPYNMSGAFTIHPFPDTPVPVLASLMTRAAHAGVHVYWLESTTTFEEWLTCNATGVNEERYQQIASRSAKSLIQTYYSNELDMSYALPSQDAVDLRALVKLIKARVYTYIEYAPWMSSATRAFLTARMDTLRVEIGGPSNKETCFAGQGLYECLVYLHSKDIASLESFVSVSDEWGSWTGLVVNAEYDPYSDAIFIPWGIAQSPFYNPKWSSMFRVATLGMIIAHEIGHFVDVSALNNASLALATDLSRVQICLSNDYTDMGSVRTNVTVTENWADFWAISTAAIPTPEFYILWAQTWCAAGTPRILNISDPHSSPYLRVNASLDAFAPFFAEFQCTTRGQPCGT